ncbi:ferric reductase NAD binding domain-containing protein [Melanogaster broomeanus]|nr:ferric reductase NAD binding domain-containing protein [Melanogaster broomeanus]
MSVPQDIPVPPNIPAPPDRILSHERYELYPKEAWYGIAIFLVGVGICQWGSVLHIKLVKGRRPNPRADEESTSPPAPRGGISLSRLPVAAINAYRVIAFRCTLEVGSYTLNTTEVLVTLAYIAYLLTWTFVNTTNLEGEAFDPKYWSNRAGMLAASQTPLLTALGTKNNLVSRGYYLLDFVTGISYEKLNYIHRAMARSCFGLLLIHASSEIYNYPRFQASLEEAWLRIGISALVALSVLCIASLRPVRTVAYEFFFYVHFLAVFIFLVGGYFHTKRWIGSYWIWPSFAIWGLDRFIRVARLVVFNHSYFGFNRHSGELDATTELLCDDFVRVRMRRPPHFNWSAGQSAYLIMPSISTLPFEAHPFSIASIDSALFLPTLGTPEKTTSIRRELVFLVKVRGGFTKRLKDAAAQNKTVKVLLDGPYGAAPDLGAYDTAVLVAGGIGVTYTLPVFLSVIEAVRKGTSSCRRLVFVWAVRDASHLHWVSDALVRANSLVPSSLSISIHVYVTKGSIPSSKSKPRAPRSLFSSAPWIKMASGRPDLKAIFSEQMHGAVGRMSVSVCGPQGLAQSVRRALCFPVSGPYIILRGGPSVTLYVESFGYA